MSDDGWRAKWRAVLVLASVCWAASARADTVLQTFAGTGDFATRPFHVDAPWELQWNADGSMNIEIRAPDGKLVDYYSGKPPAGSAYEPRTGDFFIKISAFKPWTVKIVAIGH